jgi:hypothetical protein
MADMSALRERINDADHTIRSIDANPSTADKTWDSARKTKEALVEIVGILKDIATFLESK